MNKGEEMKIKETITIKLEIKEAEALKIILGKISDVDKKSFGLDELDKKFISELYNKLPYREES